MFKIAVSFSGGVLKTKRGCVISHIQYALKEECVFHPHALKGQKLLAQGIALGIYGCKPVALYGQKLSKIKQFIRLLPLQGVLLTAINPGGCPRFGAFGPPSPFQPYSSHQFLLQLASIGYIF